MHRDSDDETGSDRHQLIQSAARRHLNDAHADLYLGLVRPAVRLLHDVDRGQRSRLGGVAVLDPAVAWPTWGGRPLSLLAVVDLAELAAVDTGLQLPEVGLLNFFYDADEQRAWGFDPAQSDAWRVIYTPPEDGVAVEPPTGAPSFPSIPVSPRQWVSSPGWEEPALEIIWQGDRDGLGDLDEQLAEEEWPEAAHHQIGGWPMLQQGSIWLECQLASNGLYVGDSKGYQDPRAAELGPGADDWVLLLQIDTDDDAGWMWGDVGVLYFTIRRQDLADGRFDRCWMVLQCG